MGFVSYRMSLNRAEEERVNDISNQVEKVIDEVDEKMSMKETLGIDFYLDKDVQELVIDGEKDEDTMFQVMRLMFSNEYTDVNDIVFLSDKDGELYSNFLISRDAALDLLEEGKEQLKESGGIYSWLDTREVSGINFIPFVREIDNLYGHDDTAHGYLVTGIQEQLLQEIYDSYLNSSQGSIYLVSPSGQILSGSDQDLIGENFIDSFEWGKRHSLRNASYYRIRVEGDEYCLLSTSDSRSGWTYVYLLKREYVYEGANNLWLFPLILSVMIVLSLAVIMSFRLSSQIVRPIRDLTNTIQEVEKGDLSIRFTVPNIEEIANLGIFFNDMMQQLEDSIKLIYEEQSQRRDAEMKALVLQINPHFLYNTLSSIIWLCNEGKDDEVIEMTSSLATFLRISISNDHELVTIREEFDHVKSYVNIQQIRFENSFRCNYQLDESIEDCYTLKVILQPLVENTVNHAIQNIDYEGIITIRAYQDGETIHITVADNANGMTQEEVDYLNDHLQNPGETNAEYGIGTQNVNSRIQLLFGKEYGLKYTKEGINIIAEITLPIVYNEEEFGQ